MLSPALLHAIAEGRAVWPDLDVPDDAFASYLLARADGPDVSKLQVGDLYLACACSRGEARALAAFDRQFLAPVEGIVRGVPGASHLAADVAQAVRTRLLGDEAGKRRIVEYRGTGSLAGWVRVVAVRAAHNAGRDERVEAKHELPPPPQPPSALDLVMRERYGEAFDAAFRAAFRALPAEDRLVMRLHFADGLNLDRLAAALDFSRATAGRRLLAARARLREETLRVLGEQLEASREEIESVLAALGSHLEVSLGALVSAA